MIDKLGSPRYSKISVQPQGDVLWKIAEYYRQVCANLGVYVKLLPFFTLTVMDLVEAVDCHLSNNRFARYCHMSSTAAGCLSTFLTTQSIAFSRDPMSLSVFVCKEDEKLSSRFDSIRK